MEGDCSELRGALGRIDIHVLTAGVLLHAALMPFILYGGGASGSGPRSIVAITYAFEAVFFLSMVFKRSKSRECVLQLWMSSTLARSMRGVVGEPLRCSMENMERSESHGDLCMRAWRLNR